jgi:hypothetical protein
LSELEEEKVILREQLASTKRKVKDIEERYSELEIQFVTVKEVKEKYEGMLLEEESKLKDVRAFNNNILKEKEAIIKKEIDKNLEITDL